MGIPRKRRPESEQERRRREYALRMPRRWGNTGRRPRSLWWFDIHRTRWRSRKRYRYAPRLDDPERADGCPIIANVMALAIDDPDYPPAWVYGPDGQPMCSAFVEIGTDRAPRCPSTIDMFSELARHG